MGINNEQPVKILTFCRGPDKKQVSRTNTVILGGDKCSEKTKYKNQLQ